MATEYQTRTRAGVEQTRMACSRCGLVRWLAIRDWLGVPHCYRGAWWPSRRPKARRRWKVAS